MEQGGLGEYEELHTLGATRVKAHLTQDSYLFIYFLERAVLISSQGTF